MRKVTLFSVLIAALATINLHGVMAQDTAAPLPTGSVNITVKSGERQSLLGFGAGNNYGTYGSFNALTPERQHQLMDIFWRDLKFNTQRLWFVMDKYSSQPGERNIENGFTLPYLTLAQEAQKRGMKYLLLAPAGVPKYLKETVTLKRTNGTEYTVPVLKEDTFAEHANIIADYIKDIRDKHGIRIEATGIQNEPNTGNDCHFTAAGMVRSVKLLRAALDARGLNAVKIIAPETASADHVAYQMVDALKADEVAWKAFAGIATHSYNMGATETIAQKIEAKTTDKNILGTNLKEYWQTESSSPGPEDPGDIYRASTAASTFLSDMNHRVTHWIHFIGFLVADPRDNGTRIMKYDPKIPGDDWMTRFAKYYYFQQLSHTFDSGAIFRKSTSDKERDMTWTYGRKPRITVAAAKNPDGSWGIGISNFTAQINPRNDFQKQNAPYAPQSFTVTIKVEELAAAGEKEFLVRRCGQDKNNAADGALTMKNGEISLLIHPLELVTLRSR